jgi:predicted transglutaminase-like cysteine proteinase
MARRSFGRSVAVEDCALRFPLGRYVSQPLTVHCHSIEEIRQFLRECKSVSDQEFFDKEDYWQPPDDFEKRKKGDREDFSFWTWRQFMDLGCET